jgi:hypothetical protein
MQKSYILSASFPSIRGLLLFEGGTPRQREIAELALFLRMLPHLHLPCTA